LKGPLLAFYVLQYVLTVIEFSVFFFLWTTLALQIFEGRGAFGWLAAAANLMRVKY